MTFWSLDFFGTSKFTFLLALIKDVKVTKMDISFLAIYRDVYWHNSLSCNRYNIWPCSNLYYHLFIVFLNSISITTSYWSIRQLILLAFIIRTRIFLKKPIKNLTWLVLISISTIIINNKKIIDLLSFKVF